MLVKPETAALVSISSVMPLSGAGGILAGQKGIPAWRTVVREARSAIASGSQEGNAADEDRSERPRPC